jgi:hypothetical protein
VPKLPSDARASCNLPEQSSETRPTNLILANVYRTMGTQPGPTACLLNQSWDISTFVNQAN